MYYILTLYCIIFLIIKQFVGIDSTKKLMGEVERLNKPTSHFTKY